MVLARHVNLAAIAQDLEEPALAPWQHPLEPGSVFRIITAMPVHIITRHLRSQAIDLVAEGKGRILDLRLPFDHVLHRRVRM
jgi:hypothetical protein